MMTKLLVLGALASTLMVGAAFAQGGGANQMPGSQNENSPNASSTVPGSQSSGPTTGQAVPQAAPNTSSQGQPLDKDPPSAGTGGAQGNKGTGSDRGN